MASYPDTTLRSLTIPKSRRLCTVRYARCCLRECQDDRVEVRVAQLDALFSSWPWLTGWVLRRSDWRGWMMMPHTTQLSTYFQVLTSYVKRVSPPVAQFPPIWTWDVKNKPLNFSPAMRKKIVIFLRSYATRPKVFRNRIRKGIMNGVK